LAQLFARRTSQEEASAALDKDPNVYRSGAVQELLGGRSAHATWHSLVEDLRVLLRTIRPAVIVAPHPLLDAAPDHQLTSIALLEAMENGSADDGLLLLYTNHHVLAEYYPFGPANTEMTLPPWFDAAAEFGGVFSYALGPIDRQRKLFALESMHDLRAAPRAVTAEDPAGRFLQMASNALREIRRNPLGTYSYYRRAVRTNELFFVYRFSDRIHISIPELQEFSYQ
jgi:LmbE family N-acetylglucosaminyl deacetylase